MKTADIVKLFEEYVQRFNNKTIIVLKKNLDNCAFKAYKKLTYSLNCIKKETGEVFNLVNIDHTARVTNEEEESKLREYLDNELILWMFEYIRKSNFNYVDE